MLAVAALFVSTVESATIHVPSEQPTLQAGVDAGMDGDTILVAAGTYSGIGNYNVNFGVKNLVLLSESGHDSTIIDCFDSTDTLRRGFIVENDQDSATVIAGFTVRNAAIGLFIVGSATIRNCFVDSNQTGIYLQGNSLLDSLTARDNGIGVLAENNSLVRLHELVLSNNGKGASLLSSSAAAHSCLVDSNAIGLEVYDGTLSIVDMVFNANDTAVAGGLGPSSAPVTGQGCNFTDNEVGIIGECSLTTCTFDGGGIAVYSTFPDDMTATECSFTNLSTAVVFQIAAKKARPRGQGQATGVAYTEPGADFENCTISNNPGDVAVITSGADGDVSALVMDSCIVTNNGGGISVFGALDLNSVLYAGNGRGIRHTVHKDVLTIHEIKNCTIVNNADTAVYIDSYVYLPLVVHTSVIAGNDGVGIAYKEQDTTNTVKVICNDVYNNSAGNYAIIADQTGLNGNTSAEPFFCLPDSGDYSIKDISPCAPGNNPCSTLVGKYPVSCIDEPPIISSADSISVAEDSLLVYHAIFTDPDGPDSIISFDNIPSWLAADADSIFGTPPGSTPDTSFAVIGSDGFKADTLIVSVDVVPVNDQPSMNPISPKELYEGTGVSFVVVAFDPDGDTLTLSAYDLPANAQYVDSGNNKGYFSYAPDFADSGDYIIHFVANDGITADTIVVNITVLDGDPIVDNLFLPEEPDSLHILSASPLLQWNYYDPTGAYPSQGYEILITSDTGATGDTLWWSDSVVSVEDTAFYAGDSLTDGTTYYTRARAFNGVIWSAWYQSSFHTNAVPSIPVVIGPTDDTLITTEPELYVVNGIDVDSDIVTYDFEIYGDSLLMDLVASIDSLPGGVDSTGWLVTDSLPDNARYYWRTRAFDGYEYSDWTAAAIFRIDMSPQPPSAPILVQPVDTLPILYNLLPQFVWAPSQDPDLQDTLLYTFYLSTDSEFTAPYVRDSLSDTSFVAIDSLGLGAHYWWKIGVTDRASMTAESNARSFWTWLSGDVDEDHSVDIGDVIGVVGYMFGDGPAIEPPLVGDVDGNCLLDISDLIYLVEFAFDAGPSPRIGCVE